MTLTGYLEPAAHINAGIREQLHRVRGERASDMLGSRKECRVRDTPAFVEANIRKYAEIVAAGGRLEAYWRSCNAQAGEGGNREPESVQELSETGTTHSGY